MAAGKNSTGGVFPSGSAVLISDRLALCAKHVFEDYWKRAEYGDLLDGENTPSFQIAAAGGFGAEARSCQWDVQKIWTSKATDVAVMALAPREGMATSWRLSPVDIAPPRVGDVVLACGFADSNAEEIVLDGSPAFVWNDRPVVSRGVVVAVHPQARDAGLLSFPCFEFDGRVDAGMSGGPVFSERGSICGLVASGEGQTGDGFRASAALLWPAMAISLDGSFLGRPPGPVPLIAAGDDGLFELAGRHRVAFKSSPDGSINTASLLKE
jgi:hypothetical protein